MGKRTNVASELLASLEEAVEIVARCRPAARNWLVPPAVNVRAVRKKVGLTKEAFAQRTASRSAWCGTGSRAATSLTRPAAPICW